MDPDIIQAVGGVVGLMVPLAAVSLGGLLLFSRSNLGRALASRISGNSRDPVAEARLDAFQDELTDVRAQLQETQERLGFAERLLARTDKPADALRPE
jgi:ubiquinone biosynthesis protein UbiJ